MAINSMDTRIERTTIEIGNGGSQYLVAYPFAIQVHFIKAQSAYIGFRLFDRLVYPECFTEIRSRSSQRRVGISVFPVADPPGCPIRRFQQSHRPSPCFTPRRSLSRFIPNHRFPVKRLPGIKRFPFISYLAGTGRCYFPGIPKIRFSFS